MADELYPGYDPEIDPNPITCWGHPTAEELEAYARRKRESVALWMWNDDHYENQLLWKKAWAEAEAAHPDLVVI
jgi:hypothetical protein